MHIAGEILVYVPDTSPYPRGARTESSALICWLEPVSVVCTRPRSARSPLQSSDRPPQFACLGFDVPCRPAVTESSATRISTDILMLIRNTRVNVSPPPPRLHRACYTYNPHPHLQAASLARGSKNLKTEGHAVMQPASVTQGGAPASSDYRAGAPIIQHSLHSPLKGLFKALLHQN